MKVLITGASSGIGRDMARIFYSKGYDLVLVARNEEKLNNLKKELEKKKLNSKIEIIIMDLSNEENCKELYEKEKDIDILVNNAGFGDCGNFTKTDLKKEINYESDIDLKEIGKHLKEIRLELGLTLRELGEKLNTAFSSLASYERGEVLIQSDILINLCKISNYSIDYVLGQSNDKYLKV